MKALSLWQPWATLVALGHKRVETRSWSTRHRGELWIHAAKRRTPDAEIVHDWLCNHVYDDGRFDHVELVGPDLSTRRLPVGAIVARCFLVDVVPTDLCAAPNAWEIDYGDLPSKGWDRAIPEFDDGDWSVLIRPDQRPLGDFSPGRFAWLLDEIEPINPPIEARGRQGLWECH